MIDIRHIKHIGQIADMIKLHKKGHEISLHKVESLGHWAWSVFIDNKKTEKRKVITVRLYNDCLLTGTVNIIKGYRGDENAWGHKLHKDSDRIDIDDLGYLKFQHFIDTRCICKRVERINKWEVSDYIYKPSN